ncbi:hypothetical protein BGX21_004738, partial [Mortierella sp. AD011]
MSSTSTSQQNNNRSTPNAINEPSTPVPDSDHDTTLVSHEIITISDSTSLPSVGSSTNGNNPRSALLAAPSVEEDLDDIPPFLPTQKLPSAVRSAAPLDEEMTQATYGAANQKILCRRLETLRTAYTFQSTMYYCKGYGLLNSTNDYTLLRKVNKEDERRAERFGDLADEVDGVIRGLKRRASFMEASLMNEKESRWSQREFMYADHRERQSKKARPSSTSSSTTASSSSSRASTSSPVVASSSSSGSSPNPVLYLPVLRPEQALLTGDDKQTLVDELRASIRSTTSFVESLGAVPLPPTFVSSKPMPAPPAPTHPP